MTARAPDAGSRTDEARAARRFVRAFVTAFLALLAGLALVSVALDPTGLLGTGLVPPAEQTSRDDKAKLFDALPAKPSVLILGSSRVWCLEPRRFAELTGRTAFNFAVDTATSDDLLAILRYAGDHGAGSSVTRILLAVEPEIWSAKRDRTARLNYSRKLRPYAAATAVAPMWTMLGELTVGETTIEGDKRSLQKLFIDRAQLPRYAFSPGGAASWPRYDEERQRGVFDRKKNASESLAAAATFASRFTEISPARLASFEAFLALAREHGVEVLAFVPALHPDAWKVLGRTPLAGRYADADALLERFETEGKLRRLFTHRLTVADFDGDPAEFYDHQHMTLANGERLLKVVLERAGP